MFVTTTGLKEFPSGRFLLLDSPGFSEHWHRVQQRRVSSHVLMALRFLLHNPINSCVTNNYRFSTLEEPSLVPPVRSQAFAQVHFLFDSCLLNSRPTLNLHDTCGCHVAFKFFLCLLFTATQLSAYSAIGPGRIELNLETKIFLSGNFLK